MMSLTPNTLILVAVRPVDFRGGIDRFATLCRYQLAQSSTHGAVFLFINRRKTMVRILHYEHNGYWLMTKRLSHGQFSFWPDGNKPVSVLDATQLRALLKNEIQSSPIK